MEAGRPGTGVDRLLHEKTLLHTSYISVRNKCHLPQLSFPFPAFLLEDVTFALFTTQKLTGASHFKALGDGRSGFRLTSFAGHWAAFLVGKGPIARINQQDFGKSAS